MLPWCTFLNYHQKWTGSNWSRSNIIFVCGDQGETGFPSNGFGFGIYTSYLCGSGPAWEDGGSHTNCELVNFRIIILLEIIGVVLILLLVEVLTA